MKKIFMLLCLVSVMFASLPVRVSAAPMDTTYQTEVETVKDSNGNEWHTNSDGSKMILKDFYVGKTNAAGYVYMAFRENINVKIRAVTVGDEFEQVGEYIPLENGRAYIFKLKNGTSINKKTKLAQVAADIVDPKNSQCKLDYTPYGTICSETNGKYFDDKGALVTEDEYNAACDGVTTPDNPNDIPNNPDNPKTGNIIPYVAVGGGLLAIAGVYFISKKSNKMYRL